MHPRQNRTATEGGDAGNDIPQGDRFLTGGTVKDRSDRREDRALSVAKRLGCSPQRGLCNDATVSLAFVLIIGGTSRRYPTTA